MRNYKLGASAILAIIFGLSCLPLWAPEVDIELQAKEVLDKVFSAYKGLKTFQEAAKVETEKKRGQTQIKNTITMKLYLQKPNKLRVEVKDPMIEGSYLVISDGKFLWIYDEALNEYIKKNMPRNLTDLDIESLRLPSCLPLSLLLSKDPLKTLTEGFRMVRLLGQQPVEKINYNLIELTPVKGTSKYRIWIGDKDNLIHKVHHIGIRVPKRTKVKIQTKVTELHLEFRVNEKIASEIFSFRPPEGARLVEKFSSLREVE